MIPEGPKPGDLDEHGVPFVEPEFDPFAHFHTPDFDEAPDWTPPPDTELDDRPMSERIEAEVDYDLADLIDTIDPAEWEDCETPVRRWLLDGFIPLQQMTLLTGPGAAGKSLASQQLCTCVAMGRPFLGVPVTGGRAMYITCEDDTNELHIRQKAICAALGISLPYLHDRLFLASLMGALGNELCTFDAEGRMKTTEAWKRLLTTIKARKITFVVLDNVAQLFTGNENIRNQVAAFCGLLNKLASETGCSVLLLGHPNKAGDDYSGSTAWNNQVRSRLFLKIPHEEGQDPEDWDARELTNGKANYSANGKQISFRWHNMAFVTDADLPGDEFDQQVRETQDKADEKRFLACLAEVTEQRRAVSEMPGRNYAPNVFAAMKTAQRMSKTRLKKAMQRLFDDGKLERGEVFRGPDRHPVTGLKLRQTGAGNAGNALGDGVRETLRETRGERGKPPSASARETAGLSTPMYIHTYPEGATAGASAPSGNQVPDLSAETPPEKRRAERDPYADDPPF